MLAGCLLDVCSTFARCLLDVCYALCMLHNYLLDVCSIFAGRLLDVCWMFARSCKRGINLSLLVSFCVACLSFCASRNSAVCVCCHRKSSHPSSLAVLSWRHWTRLRRRASRWPTDCGESSSRYIRVRSTPSDAACWKNITQNNVYLNYERLRVIGLALARWDTKIHWYDVRTG